MNAKVEQALDNTLRNELILENKSRVVDAKYD
jgi:hypothetical protein